MEQWPEGRAADPEAARKRYDADLRLAREQRREILRAEPSDAHMGLGAVVIASVIVALLADPLDGALVTGAFAALYLLALVIFLRRARGREAARRAYLRVFGWGGWL